MASHKDNQLRKGGDSLENDACTDRAYGEKGKKRAKRISFKKKKFRSKKGGL